MDMPIQTELFFQGLSYILSIFLGQIISGLIVVSGEGWGKIAGQNQFVKPYVFFLYGLLDTVVCAILLLFASSYIVSFLKMYPFLIYGVTLETAFVAYVKTCHTLGPRIMKNFRKYWKGVVFVQLTSIANFGIVAFLIYYKII